MTTVSARQTDSQSVATQRNNTRDMPERMQGPRTSPAKETRDRLQKLQASLTGNICVYTGLMKSQKTPNTIEPDKYHQTQSAKV